MKFILLLLAVLLIAYALFSVSEDFTPPKEDIIPFIIM